MNAQCNQYELVDDDQLMLTEEIEMEYPIWVLSYPEQDRIEEINQAYQEWRTMS